MRAATSAKDQCHSQMRSPSLKKEEKEEVALTAVINRGIDYESDWIIDSGYSNHLTGDIKKLERLQEYKGNQVIVTANNSKLPISYVGRTVISPHIGPKEFQLQGVYHVPGMKKNLLSVSQLTAQGNYVVFGHCCGVLGQVNCFRILCSFR